MPPDLGADEDELADEDQAGQIEEEDEEKEKHFQFRSRLQIRQSLYLGTLFWPARGSKCLREAKKEEVIMPLWQVGRSWQPFGERKNGLIIFVRCVFAIFATNSSFLHVIAILLI